MWVFQSCKLKTFPSADNHDDDDDDDDGETWINKWHGDRNCQFGSKFFLNHWSYSNHPSYWRLCFAWIFEPLKAYPAPQWQNYAALKERISMSCDYWPYWPNDPLITLIDSDDAVGWLVVVPWLVVSWCVVSVLPCEFSDREVPPHLSHGNPL